MTLKNVLEEICAEEYALPENAPRHRFSTKHRRAVNDILYSEKAKRRMSVKRRVLVIAAAAAVLAVITGAASIMRYNGFRFTKERIEGYNYFMMLAENDKNAPKTIEKVCYDINAPEKYKRLEEMCHISEDDVYEVYVDTSADHGSSYFFTWQVTKSTFVDPIQPDQDVCTPIEVKGHNGFTKVTTIDLSDGRQIINNSIIWDCGDYIHFVNGSVSMEELMSIVEGMTEK